MKAKKLLIKINRDASREILEKNKDVYERLVFNISETDPKTIENNKFKVPQKKKFTIAAISCALVIIAVLGATIGTNGFGFFVNGSDKAQTPSSDGSNNSDMNDSIANCPSGEVSEESESERRIAAINQNLEIFNFKSTLLYFNSEAEYLNSATNQVAIYNASKTFTNGTQYIGVSSDGLKTAIWTGESYTAKASDDSVIDYTEKYVAATDTVIINGLTFKLFISVLQSGDNRIYAFLDNGAQYAVFEVDAESLSMGKSAIADFLVDAE